MRFTCRFNGNNLFVYSKIHVLFHMTRRSVVRSESSKFDFDIYPFQILMWFPCLRISKGRVSCLVTPTAQLFGGT